MSDTTAIAITTAVVTALPPTIMATAALWKVVRVHKELNSRLTQWKEETAQANAAAVIAAKALGAKEEKDKRESTQP